MQLNTPKIEIVPEKYYSASAAIVNGFFPWIKSIMTMTTVLQTEEGLLLYQPIVKQGKKYKKYQIKGSKILEIRDLAEKGQLKS